MAFRHPAMLWWLFALLLPVIIHLFNFRRHKTILFSNIHLLRNLQQETNKTNKLKHRLILLSRMMAIAALVVAFAQPYVKKSDQFVQKKNNAVSIYIDNSPSMQRRGGGTSFLEDMRRQAGQIAMSFDLNTRFVLLTNEFLPERNRLLSRDDFMRELLTVAPTSLSADLGDVIRRNRSIYKGDDETNRFLFLLSDFQKSATNPLGITPDSLLQLVLMKTETTKDQNLFLDTLWFESPVLRSGLEAKLHVGVINDSDQEVNGIPVRLEVNGRQLAIANASVAPRGRSELLMQFIVPQNKGFHRAVLSLQDYPIVFDDELYFSFEVMPKLRVLELYGSKADPYTALLFGNDVDVEMISQPVMNVDIQSIAGYQLVILNQAEPLSSGLSSALNDFLESGGSIVLLPSENTVDDYNAFVNRYGFHFLNADTTTTRVAKVEEKHPFFADIVVKIPEQPDLPIVKKHFPIKISAAANSFSLMSLLSNEPFLLVSNVQNGGSIFAFAAPNHPAYSSFVNHSLFAPVFYKMLYLSPIMYPTYYLNRESIEFSIRTAVSASEGKIRVVDQNHKTSIIPGVSQGVVGNRMRISGLLNEATHYDVLLNDSLIGLFSVNTDRRESAMEEMDADELQKTFNKDFFAGVRILDASKKWLTQDVAAFIEGKTLINTFLIMALAFILVEVLLIRLWK